MSEVWFGAHPDGPTLLTGGQTLAEHIGEDPKRALGGGLLYAFGPTLPYLAKIIAPRADPEPAGASDEGDRARGLPARGGPRH